MQKILCVDDDANILAAYQRNLRQLYKIETALGGEEGLKILAQKGPFAVVVSDLRMPGMDGIQFLAQAKDLSPDTVRIMLTGNADMQTAIDAVNEGNIFRFLTKPCATKLMLLTLEAAVRQYLLVTAEKELLERTLGGSVKVLTDVLSLVSPVAFSRASRARRLIRKLAPYLEAEPFWEIELAAMLSQIGCVTMPPEVLENIYRGLTLNTLEQKMFAAHPQTGSELVRHIPRLERVAEIIAYQEKHYNGQGTPADNRSGKTIPFGSRVLHVILDYDTLVTGGKEPRAALGELRRRDGYYDPEILASLERIIKAEAQYDFLKVNVEDLDSSMIFAEDVQTTSGLLLIAKGQEVTPCLKERLINFNRMTEIRQPIQIIIKIPFTG